MVRYSSSNMFFLFIPFFIFLIWYVRIGIKNKIRFNNLGQKPVRSFLLNRINRKKVYFRSRLLIFGIFFIVFASTGPQIGVKLTEMTREGIDI